MCRRFNSAPRHPGRAGPKGPPGAGRRPSKLPCAPAADCGEFRLGVAVFVKGGVAPFHTFPPVTRATNRRFAAIVFFAGRERRLLASSPGGGRQRCASAQRSGGSLLSFTTRRAGNADLWSAPLREAQRDGVYHAAVRMTLNAGVPAEKGPPRNWGSFPPPAFGGLCRAPPGELPRGRRSLACAPLCLVAWAPRRAPSRNCTFMPGGVYGPTRSCGFLPVGAGAAACERSETRSADLRRACDSGSAMTDLRYRHQGGTACE